ncbi:MAG: DUF1800 domain-containing protein [Chloroflexota bacterium]|nr:DUF1800 domain-containing protein [Chloroflexota bacterium]
MVVSSPVKELTGVELMAHLYRRAGFGATRDELEAALANGYEATVEQLLHPEEQPDLEYDLIYRFYPDVKEAREIDITQSMWLYRMVNTKRPLEEKMALFWHSLFATAFNKSNHAQMLQMQVDMFRRLGLGNFRDILVELSRDPSMIFWLDNQENTTDVHNENYGRELLELFSMGIGNYTEDDVKACARAFTGWGIKNLLNTGPFGRNVWEFKFYPELHDYGEKEFLGERGNFDGPDVIDIIVRQPATARFIATRLYLFFVSDTPDEAAIEELAQFYQESGHDIRAVMRALLLADFFRSERALYAKVKSPAEHVAGVTRLVGDFRFPEWGIKDVALEFRYMGQDLMNPPSVEGWHTGKEWIDTGILVERVNFASAQVGDIDKPGIRRIIEILRERGPLSPDQLVDGCLELVGPLRVTDRTRRALIEFAERGGALNLADGRAAEQRVGALLQMIVATREFQWA